MSWQYTVERIDVILKSVKEGVVRESLPLGPLRFTKEAVKDCASPDLDDSAWGTMNVGDTYEAREQSLIFRSTVTIPQHWDGKRVYAGYRFREENGHHHFNFTEALIYIDGSPAQAIDGYHHELLLTPKAKGGQTHQLTADVYSGLADTWGVVGVITKVSIERAELQWIDAETEGLYYDLYVAVESAKTMDNNTREYTTIVNVLDATINLLDFTEGGKSERFYRSVETARAYLQKNLYKKYHADPDFSPTLWGVGHAHIDTAWLWRLSHTRKKIERTFTTATTLMKEYPDYKFTCSQPQQYDYIKEDNPEIYERIKAAVKKGQWETVGGMWIESDCNVVSGESLVRQFLYGLRFFKKEFGTHTDTVWLPDVFGYSAAFPQIIKKAGMKYFMTIKIFWSKTNKPPYQTFEWEGIDGTTVLTHYSPNGDYNCDATPAQLAKLWEGYNQKNLNDSALLIFGYGNGGGGPTRKMLEIAERVKDFPGMPKVKLEKADDFFGHLEKQVAGNPQLPRWVGELYLEFHRGTYTSQSRNKRYNRQSELGLQTAEQISSLALLLTGAEYPLARINRAWELTLLNQFHDIIPGSSIHEVYEDSDKDYSQILGIAGEAASSALQAIAAQVKANPGDVIVYNPLSWQRSDVAEAPRSLHMAGQPIVSLDGEEKTLIALKNAPALGYETLVSEHLHLTDDVTDPGALHATANVLENGFFKLTLDSNGEIASLWDKKNNREVIDENSYCRGNALLSFEDKPMDWEAWEIEVYYNDKMTAEQNVTEMKVTEEGPIRASIEITRKFGRGSILRQRVSLYRDIPRIDFDCEIDWQERQTLLKVAFPVNVHSPRATYDIQFGTVERPTHWNTSWDWAKFEVCAHKWADLSEGDYGVSLLSDCKYGWDIKGNVMRLTLLKGAMIPDPTADIGRHRFAYSLYPHAGDWRTGGTVRQAYEFNIPVKLASATGGGALESTFSLVTIDKPNLIIETIKKAEDDDTLIIRMFEAYGSRGSANLTFARPVKAVAEVNLMEEETHETKAARLSVNGAIVGVEFLPYEIKTLKLRL